MGVKVINILNEVKKRASKIEFGTQFSLDDLFTGIEWNSYEKSERLLVGKKFRVLVSKGEIQDVEISGKTSSNKQTYKKVKRKE